MNRILQITTGYLALLLLFSASVYAQPDRYSNRSLPSFLSMKNADGSETPHISAYVADPFTPRSHAWWRALGGELSLARKTYRNVSQQALQKLIFFQVNHPDKINQAGSIPTLLDIYLKHHIPEMRMMAITAVVEIGDAAAIEVIEKNIERQRVEKVRIYAKKALASYYYRQ